MHWSWKRITLISLTAAAVITCIVFAIPFNRVPYYAQETYLDSEIRQEPFTATESYVSTEIIEREETIYDGTPFSVPEGISVPFSVAQDDTRLVGSFTLPAPGGFYLYSYSGRITYEQLGSRGYIDISLTEGEYTAVVRERASWEERIYLNLRLLWTEIGEVTDNREVTKYREVPVTVEKQRTVTNYRRMSLWKIFFSR